MHRPAVGPHRWHDENAYELETATWRAIVSVSAAETCRPLPGLRLGRGASRGRDVGSPDDGFFTQVRPGEANTPVIELEQMSPLYQAGEAAEFTMLVGLATE